MIGRYDSKQQAASSGQSLPGKCMSNLGQSREKQMRKTDNTADFFNDLATLRLGSN
jgi:hypothetical protein